MTDAGKIVGTVVRAGQRRFRLDAVLGAGDGGAVVFRGRDVEDGTLAAIRCPGVPDDLGGLTYDAALEGFLRDAAELARATASSEDIEQVLGFGVAHPDAVVGRLPYLVFEWLEGKSLEQLIAERGARTPSLGEAIAILEPAARALAALHAVGLAHRDVRPKNLWLASTDGRVKMKLTQLALASRIGPLDDAYAPRYGAPEHFKRTYGVVGPATDVYGLALCLVELLSGVAALEGADAAELYLATSDLAERPSLRARGVTVSDAVEAVIARALAVDPKRRFPNAREMWDALASAIPELTPSVPVVRLADEPAPPGTTAEDARLGEFPASTTPAVSEPRGSQRLAWGAVAFGIALATVIVAAKLHRPVAAAPPAAPDAGTEAGVNP